MSQPDRIDQLATPAVVIDAPTFAHNRAAMDAVLPGRRLRPHVKAFKSTAVARILADDGHDAFCGATLRELEGLAAAGLGADLLLANETLDAARLAAFPADAHLTVAVDSRETLDAAVAGGVRSVLIDVDVGLPRCGCLPADAGPLADRARAAGIEVRGVMGYEGHLMMVLDREDRSAQVAEAMALLARAAEDVGGEIVSGGGTGTFDLNPSCTEIQAGSYVFLDADYDRSDLPFDVAISVVATIISTSSKGYIVADAGLKAFGMDHGNPTWADGEVFFCSDEHITLIPSDPQRWSVGDRVALVPAHLDPTVARHERLWVADGDRVVDCWDVDLRHW